MQRTSQAWQNPSINATKLPVTCDVAALSNSEKTHDVWAAYFNYVEACGAQLRAVTGLSPADATDTWEEVHAPDIANFERARDNLQTPKRLRLGPLLVAAVEASSPSTRDLLKLQELDPPPEDDPGSAGLYEDSWMRTVFENWNQLVANFETVSRELRRNQVGSTEYKFAVNQTISKLQAALQETDTKIQLVVAMIGSASRSSDGTVSVRESLGQL
jgi:hypothetical protein